MTQVGEAILLANVVSPGFEFRRVDFHGGPARPTRQVVVMHVDDASAIERLAPIGHDEVHFAAFRELLELRVDRRERDLAAIFDDEGVEVLGTHEALDATQDTDHLSPLGGISRRRHATSLAGRPCFLE